MPSVNYLWDPVEDNVIGEFDDDGSLLVEYTTEPELHGDVISQRRDGETNCYYSDGLGSTTEVTNAAGDTIATRAYSAFGGTTESTGNIIFPFQYLGQKGYYFDSETSTYYIRRRPYTPAIGRFLSTDLLRYGGGMSLYSYVRNRPLMAIDPSGLRCKVCNWERHWTTTSGRGRSTIVDIGVLDDQLLGSPIRRAVDHYISRINNKLRASGLVFDATVDSIDAPPWEFRTTADRVDPDARQLLSAGAVRLAVGIVLVTADVCEDNEGDCLVTVKEVRDYEYFDGAQWQYHPEEGFQKLVPVVEKKKPLSASGGVPSNVYISTITGKETRECDKRIILVDMPHVKYAVPSPLNRIAAKQIFVISDAVGDVGWETLSFSLGPNSVSPYKVSWNVNPGSSQTTAKYTGTPTLYQNPQHD